MKNKPLVREECIRADVRAMQAYVVQPSAGFIKLDAMENPFGLSPELQAELGQRLGRVALRVLERVHRTGEHDDLGVIVIDGHRAELRGRRAGREGGKLARLTCRPSLAWCWATGLMN